MNLISQSDGDRTKKGAQQVLEDFYQVNKR
jgi:hypothetical protein